jgi:uncharacterized protein
MTTAAEIIRNFYAALRSGDTTRALGLMSEDIEWVTMWQYKAGGRGPDKVAEGVLMPLMKEWKSFEFIPAEFIVDGDSVVSLGRFIGVHGVTGKTAMYGRSPTAGSHAFASTSTRLPSPRRGDSPMECRADLDVAVTVPTYLP